MLLARFFAESSGIYWFLARFTLHTFVCMLYEQIDHKCIYSGKIKLDDRRLNLPDSLSAGDIIDPNKSARALDSRKQRVL
jgi:hypothetical protein